MTNHDTINASVVLLVKNGMPLLERVVAAVRAQQTPLAVEIIAIDSGSRDASVTFLASQKDIRLFPIKPEEFSHGRTRNYAASLAQGRYIVFLSQDCIPADDHWLDELIGGFREDKTVGVYSRQIVPDGVHPLEQRLILEEFPTTWERHQITTASGHSAKRSYHFSNASSAIERKLLQQIPFDDDVQFAEDREWARRVVQAGYTIAYEPRSQAIHVHNYTLKQRYVRSREGTRSTVNPARPIKAALVTVYEIARDWGFVLRLRESISFKLYWCLYAPLYRCASLIGILSTKIKA